MNLQALLEGAEVVETSGAELEVRSLGALPGHGGRGGVFFKCVSPTMHVPASEALSHGAAHVVLDENDPELETLPPGVSRTIVRNVHRAYATACANFTGNAQRQMTFIGVTGTKGKTTVCHLVDAALRKAGLRTALVSSLVMRLPESERHAVNSTPEPLLLHLFLAEALRQKVSHVVMEASSIGIAEERVHGIGFDAVAFLNLGSDHFEYHGGRANYIAAKRRLICDPSLHASGATLCVINGEDEVGRELAACAEGRVQTFGLHDGDLVADSYSFDASGMTVSIQGRELRLPLLGRHNVANALAAVALAARVLGSVPAAIEAMRDAPPIAGRLERVPSRLGVEVYVDYAHTPESVAAVLETIAAIAPDRRRVAVVGCSGNSDRRKRPLIARAAAAASDICILTSDNPNHEHPAAIIRDMVFGLRGRAEVRTIIDRPTAIAQAIELAMPDGVVVLLGKGTERFQLIEGKRIPHSDSGIAARILRDGERRAAEQPR